MADETPVEPIIAPVPETPPAEVAKYTDKQVNDLIAKNLSKETAKILEAAGVKDLAELAALKKKPVDTTTAAEDPLKKELEEVKKATGELATRADRNEALAVAMKSGVVDEKKLESVVKLAMSPAYEGTVAERIQKVIADVPEFITVRGEPFGKETKSQATDATVNLLNQARERAGLPPQK